MCIVGAAQRIESFTLFLLLGWHYLKLMTANATVAAVLLDGEFIEF